MGPEASAEGDGVGACRLVRTGREARLPVGREIPEGGGEELSRDRGTGERGDRVDVGLVPEISLEQRGSSRFRRALPGAAGRGAAGGECGTRRARDPPAMEPPVEAVGENRIPVREGRGIEIDHPSLEGRDENSGGSGRGGSTARGLREPAEAAHAWPLGPERRPHLPRRDRGGGSVHRTWRHPHERPLPTRDHLVR